jgi:hypothetical protein
MSFWKQVPAGAADRPSVMQVYGVSTGTSREAITFDWTNPDSGSVADCGAGDKIWMGLESPLDNNTAFQITHLWEWDYGQL